MRTRSRVGTILICTTAVVAGLAAPASAANPITFAPRVDYPTGTNPEAVISADLNGDTVPDLITADRYEWQLSILLGTGGGAFGSRIGLFPGQEPTGLAAADFNADGRADIAVTVNGAVSVLLGNGNATFTRVEYPVSGGAEGIGAGDVNGDNKADVVISRPGGVTVLLGNGDGTLGAPVDHVAGGYSRGVVLTDLTGDGKVDIGIAGFFANAVSVLAGNGTGGFAAPVTYAAGTQPIDIAAGDFNGDGRTDLATADFGSDTSSVLLGQSGGTFAAPTTLAIGSRPFGIAVADLDGDVDHDFAVSVAGADSVAVLGNGDGTFVPATTLGTGSTPTDLLAADVNADNRPDLVTTNRFAHAISVLLNVTVPMESNVGVKLKAAPKFSLLVSKVDYTLTVTNAGPDTLRSATIVSTLPVGAQATPGPNCTVSGRKVTCLVGELASGGTVTRKFTVPLGLLSLGQYTVTATRTASAPADPNPANDSSSATCTVLSILLTSCG